MKRDGVPTSKASRSHWFAAVGIVVAFLCGSAALSEEPSTDKRIATDGAESRASESQEPEIAAARDCAKTMHQVYAATLEVMHQRYFHGDRAVVPARALEDVFSEIQEKSKIQARWISVNMKPMSVDHQPKTDFEKQAAKEIAAGKGHLEIVEDGYYRRAGAIPLASGCVHCHGGFFKAQSSTPKFAGLVISVPIGEREAQESK